MNTTPLVKTAKTSRWAWTSKWWAGPVILVALVVGFIFLMLFMGYLNGEPPIVKKEKELSQYDGGDYRHVIEYRDYRVEGQVTIWTASRQGTLLRQQVWYKDPHKARVLYREKVSPKRTDVHWYGSHWADPVIFTTHKVSGTTKQATSFYYHKEELAKHRMQFKEVCDAEATQSRWNPATRFQREQL